MSLAQYQGVGVVGSSAEYLYDGATGADIGAQCLSVYAFIARCFDWAPASGAPAPEVWLFGLSRGAYIVRCIGGMVNNCGVLRDPRSPDLDTLTAELYLIYRSRAPEDAPNTGARALAFSQRWCHVALPEAPIRFLGLIDTVGSLGIPTLSAGMPLGYVDDNLKFYDCAVSHEVQHVRQAQAIHDRLALFDPCHVARGPSTSPPYPNTPLSSYTLEERWFPGWSSTRSGDVYGLIERTSAFTLKALTAITLGTVGAGTILHGLILRNRRITEPAEFYLSLGDTQMFDSRRYPSMSYRIYRTVVGPGRVTSAML